MLIASIIIASIAILILVMGFVLHKLPNKISYEIKTKPPRYHLVSGIVIAIIGLFSLVGSALLMVFDSDGAFQVPLFVLGCLAGLYGSIFLFILLLGFVAIKGDEIYVRLFFKTKKTAISEIKKISRGPSDFTIYFKDGYKAPFFGKDTILDKIIERKNPETPVEDFVDPKYLWNNPKKMKMNKISSIGLFVAGVLIMGLSCVLSPFDKPIAEGERVDAYGYFESAAVFPNGSYCFYFEIGKTEYQIPKEVGRYLDQSIFDNIHEGDLIILKVEYHNDLKPRKEGCVNADRVCGVVFNSKEYLTYEDYRTGIIAKRTLPLAAFSFAVGIMAYSALAFTNIVYFENANKSIEANNATKDKED